MSWSELTPYRLVTSSSDGLARMWDIREAAINRYGAHVSKRADYKLPLSNTGRSTSDGSESVSRSGASSAALASGAELLPPLPVRNGGSVGGNADNGDAVDENAVGAGGNAAAGAAGVGNVQPGQFVRNDMLDEGVRLVTKLQHGAPPDESGAATRSRRKAVKVICIARCPRGGHFATGAEDGICRVWSEEDGDAIAKQDAKHTSDLFQSGQRVVARRSGRVQQQTEGMPLALLCRVFDVRTWRIDVSFFSVAVLKIRTATGRTDRTREFHYRSPLFTQWRSTPLCKSEGRRDTCVVLD